MNRQFQTTRWSVVMAAQHVEVEESREALAALCEAYWFPLYSYVRYRGYPRHTAEDLTQEFFARFLEKEYVRQVDRDKGRFRSFLISSMNNFLADEWDKTQAQKRGGGQFHFSLDFDRAERLLQDVVSAPLTPEELYDRNWAQTTLASALQLLETEYTASGKTSLFGELHGLLGETKPKPRYADLGERLGMSEGAVKVAVHRLRKRYGEHLRSEIAQTVLDPDEVEQELKYLLNTIQSG